MKKLAFAAWFCVAWAVTCWAQTALRPDQISPSTPDLIWAPSGNGYQIGSTVPWRTDSSATPTFLAADAAKVVELTAGSAITATLPDITTAGTPPPFGDGFGFAIQTKAQPLTLNRAGTQTINGQTLLKIGPYQMVNLLSRNSNWYAIMSVPQPSAQTGATRLCDDMTWNASGCTGTAPTISGVTLSNGLGFTTPATSGSTIDTLTANCSAGSCAGATFGPLATTGACSGATSNSSFTISGSNLNIGGSTISTAGNYPIGIPVTLAGATNSGTCYPFTLVGSAAATTAQWDPSTTTGHDPSITLSTTTTTNDTATGTAGAATFASARATAPSYAVGTNHKVIVRFDIITASSNTTGAHDGLGSVVGVFGAGNALNKHVGFGVSPLYDYAAEGGAGGDFKNGVANGTTTACSNVSNLNYNTGSSVYLAIDFNTGNVWCSGTCVSGAWAGGNPDVSSTPVAVLSAGTYFIGWSGANFFQGPDKVKMTGSPVLTSCGGVTTYHTWDAG